MSRLLLAITLFTIICKRFGNSAHCARTWVSDVLWTPWNTNDKLINRISNRRYYLWLLLYFMLTNHWPNESYECRSGELSVTINGRHLSSSCYPTSIENIKIPYFPVGISRCVKSYSYCADCAAERKHNGMFWRRNIVFWYFLHEIWLRSAPCKS